MTESKIKALETILVLILALLVLYCFTGYQWSVYLAIVLAVIGLFIPPLTQALHTGWMKLALAIGSVSNRILLAAVFFLVLVPLSFLRRIFSRKSKATKSPDSFFNERNFTYNRKSMEEPW